jgi:hypothetical protein
MNKRFNEKEWFSAVFMAKSMLELTPNPEFNITEQDLKNTAMEYLNGLIARHDGNQPTLSDKAREITSILQSYATIEIAKNGGGLQ